MTVDSKRCSKCGEVKPLSEFCKSSRAKDGLSGRCRGCSSEYARMDHINNPEKRGEYYAKNSKHILEKSREYYANNREQVIESGRKYRADNAEKIKETKRRHYSQHRFTTWRHKR